METGLDRAYRYQSDDVRDLFEEVLKSLAFSVTEDDVIPRILESICRHFKFGGGFIYELDHTGTFRLEERFAICEQLDRLPQVIKRKDRLSVEEIGKILASPDFLPDSAKPSDSNAAVLTPICGDGGMIGFVGMMDRRRNILMDKQSERAINMMLNLLGNGVKARIAQRNLKFTHQAMVNIMNNIGIDVYVNDFDTHEILYANCSMAAAYGGLETMLGKKCWQTLYDDKPEPCEYCPKEKILDENGKPTKVHSWDYRRPLDGKWFRVISAAFRWTDGRLAHVVSSVDITEAKQYEEIIRHRANHDELTGLPNRQKLRLDHEKALLSGDGDFYLLFFDLDKFKSLNDSLGHEVGDELLMQIGKAFMEHPLTASHIYRHGGDEFVLLYHDVEREHIRRVVDFLLDRFEQPWYLKNAAIVCRVSIGVAAAPRADAGALASMLHAADMMMFKAKESSVSAACFTGGEIIIRKPNAD